MELEVTSIVAAHLNGNPEAWDCSNSVANLGPNAGKITWNNSLKLGARLANVICDTDEKRGAIQDHFREYGAWEDDEINEWDDDEIAGMIVQEVMAEIRRLEDRGIDLEDFTNEEFQEATENEGGRFYKGDNENWYYYLGF